MIQIKMRRFIAKYFGWLAKAYYNIFISAQLVLSNKPIILILTPGKVGSSTLYYNLKRNLNKPIYHIHCISKNGIEESKRAHLNSDRKSIPLHLIIADILSKKIDLKRDNVKVISVIREPISRYISSFFQNIEFYKNSIESKDLTIDVEASMRLIELGCNRDICIELDYWFKSEVESTFGINIFDLEFDLNYNLKSKDKTFTLFRMEDMNKAWEGIVEELIDSQVHIPLDSFNVGEKKYYSEVYSKVKNDLKIDGKTFEGVVEHPIYKKFYADRIESSKKKWVRSYD